MAEKHPDEFELLSYVEEESATDARQEVAEHLVACRSCAEQLRRLRPAAPLCGLLRPRALRRATGAHARRATRAARAVELQGPLKRVLVIAAPVAAAAALIGVVVVNGPYGGDDAGDAGGGRGGCRALEMGQAEEESAGEGEEGGGADATVPAGTLVRNVAGPASAVVDLLAAEGISAKANQNSSVTAQGRQPTRAALEGRPDGTVAVYVK